MFRTAPYHETINTLDAKDADALTDLIEKAIGDGIFPAAALAVIQGDDIVLDAAWGRIDPDEGRYIARTDTRFDLASVTKLFTTTAFLSLIGTALPDDKNSKSSKSSKAKSKASDSDEDSDDAENGEADTKDGKAKKSSSKDDNTLSLETPLVAVIPEFGESGPRGIDGGQDPHSKEMLDTPDDLKDVKVDPATVTFRHLLTHTSGLAPWRDVYKAAGDATPAPDKKDSPTRDKRWSSALAALCQYPFVGEPDGVIRYSDIGLMLLGEATSRLHGKPGKLDDAIQERVLKPLSVEDVAFNPVRDGHVEQHQTAPTEHDTDWRKRRIWGEVHDENASGVGGVAGHAGLFATARSVARLGHAWLKDPAKIFKIPADVARAARTEQATTDDDRRGLGFMIRSKGASSASEAFSLDSFGHTGFTGTSLWVDPDAGLVVAFLTNAVYPGREKTGFIEFRQEVHRLLAKITKG